MAKAKAKLSIHSVDDDMGLPYEDSFPNRTDHPALRGRQSRRADMKKGVPRRLSFVMTTEEFNKDTDLTFYGPYSHIRKQMDYSHHVHYKKERQWLQDSIIEDCLEEDNNEALWKTPIEPWLLYMVGSPGAGKQYTFLQLVQDGRLPLLSFVLVDPDAIRRRLPEFESYLQKYPDCVDELTRKEAGYIAEILVRAALQAGRNVVWDGALYDGEWFAEFTKQVKEKYSNLKVGVLHVTAPREVILDRVVQQARITGRTIPEETIDYALEQIPKSILQVAPLVDYYCVIFNHDELTILTQGEDWDTFRLHFLQTCALQPGQPELLNKALEDDEKKESLDAIVRAAPVKPSRRHQRRFSALLSTELNHMADKLEFFGPFSHIRETLDYDYHVPYTHERQRVQDAIIKDMLGTAVIKDKNGDIGTTPTEPWIVFLAGAMGAGKTHTIRKLVEKGRFPLLAFVKVNFDEIRRHLPEFHLYVEESPELAGELTRKEAGFIAEILTLAGLQAGKNVLVDGSLRDYEWYKKYFARLRKCFPRLRLAIIHVTAPREAVFQRAAVCQKEMMCYAPESWQCSHLLLCCPGARNDNRSGGAERNADECVRTGTNICQGTVPIGRLFL